MWNDVFTRNCVSARGCDIIACATGNKRIGSESARHETAKNRPIPITGRSIGASLELNSKLKPINCHK